MMASAALLQEDLKCSICLNIYSEPTTLPCGHTFCKKCLQNTFKSSDHRPCPECRYKIPPDIKLIRNTKMCNIVEQLSSAKLGKSKGGCSLCDGVAKQLCLDCEAVLCEVHLEKHQNTGHIFSDLHTKLQSRKCPAHRELFKYYCTEDSAHICASCGLIGDHKEHRLQKISDLYDWEKTSLKILEDLLTTKKSETDNKIAAVKNHKENIAKAIKNHRKVVILMIGDIKKELEALERQILCTIKSQEDMIGEKVSQVLKLLEGQICVLNTQIKEIQDLCKSTDPLTVVERGPSTNDKAKSLLNVDNNLSVKELDTGLISVTLHFGLRRLTNSLPLLIQKRGFHTKDATSSLHPMSQMTDLIQSFSNLNLDGQSLRSAFSAATFSSGQHYWELEASDKPCWTIGVSYCNQRAKVLSSDSEFWGLQLTKDKLYKAVHNGQEVVVKTDSPVQALAVYLEYETGIVSFYQLSSTIRHLCSIHAIFTRPLYITAYVEHDGWIRIRK